MSSKYIIEEANKALLNTKIDKKYYPRMNFAAPAGWINDPNGVVFYKTELHLFYQHYPYDSVHGKMHWGHAKTNDGLNWEHLDVALSPDKDYDKDGVFSGSALEKDGKLYIMYSGNIEYEAGKIKQTQNIAISEDGIHFEKYDKNPVIDHSNIPEGTSKYDFRDPKVFVKDNKYYAVIGSKTENERGQVLLYESADMLEWEFTSIVLPPNKYLGDMVECPDLITFDEKDFFLLSAMNYTDAETGEFFPHVSWIIEGKMNWVDYVFDIFSIRKMDDGFDFYAPQTALISENPSTYVAIAWQQAWNRTLPSHDENHNWAGQMTLPRKLILKEGELLQTPYPSILKELRYIDSIDNEGVKITKSMPFIGDVIKLKMKNNQSLELSLETTDRKGIYLKFDKKNNNFQFSREKSKKIIGHGDRLFAEKSCDIPFNDDIWKILIFIDTSSIQIFINDYYTFTSTFYVDNELSKIIIGEANQFEQMKIGKL